MATKRLNKFSPTGSVSGSTRKMKAGSTVGGGSQYGDQTPLSHTNSNWEEEELVAIRKRYQDVEERRLKEWENYQRSHRSSLEHSGSAKAFLDISIGDVPAGRLMIELFEELVPLTVENFRMLVTGASPYDPQDSIPKLDYIDCAVHRIDRRSRCFCMGELYGVNVAACPTVPGGTTLHDENFGSRHNQRGMLSMMSRGPNSVGSAFSITLDAAPMLDYKQVVFGKVIDGFPVLEKIEAVTVDRIGTPTVPITVAFCGALTGPKPPGVFEIAQRNVNKEHVSMLAAEAGALRESTEGASSSAPQTPPTSNVDLSSSPVPRSNSSQDHSSGALAEGLEPERPVEDPVSEAVVTTDAAGEGMEGHPVAVAAVGGEEGTGLVEVEDNEEVVEDATTAPVMIVEEPSAPATIDPNQIVAL